MFGKSDCWIFPDIVTEYLRTPQLLVNGSQKDDILSTFSRLFFDDPNFSTPKFSSSSVLAQFTVRNKNFPYNHKYRKILAPFYRYIPKFISCFITSLFLPYVRGVTGVETS